MLTETLELIERSKDGDKEALGDVLSSLRGYVIKIASGYVRDSVSSRYDSSDVFQLTCHQVCKSISTYRGESVDEFKGFVASVARNTAANLIRRSHTAKRSVLRESSISDSISVSDDPSIRIEVMEDFSLVKEAMNGLSDNMRTNIELSYLKGLSYAEISEITGQKPNLIRASVFRGIKRIRERLEV